MTTNDDLKLRVERALREGELSTLMVVLGKVQMLTADNQSSAKELAKVIRMDSVLTARVLRLVNSVAFGFDRRITSVDEATVIVGYNRLRTLCSAIMTAGSVDETNDPCGLDRIELWKHSLGTAQAAEYLKKIFLTSDHDNMFMQGLLCNIGRLVLDQYFEDEYRESIRMAREENISLLTAEKRLFGVTHAEVGFWAAEYWAFDEHLCHAIKYHHGPSLGKNIDVLNLAYVITHAIRVGDPGNHLITRLLPGVFKRLEIDSRKLQRIIADLVVEYDHLHSMFEHLKTQ